MLRRWLLPLFIFLFALLSLMTLRSIAPTLLQKQALYFALGAVIFFLTAKISFQKWLILSPYVYGLVVVLLILTKIIGKVTRGATSWIPIGSFHVQPSQIAVIATGLFLISLLSKKEIKTWEDFFRLGFLAAIPAALIFIIPELGTTIIYTFSIASIFFLSKTKPRFLFLSLIVGVCVIVFSWNFLLRAYQKQRITSFLNVNQDQTGGGYNALQSVIAVGSGQLYGRGIGQGVQSHLRFLPERQTDFVFASFAEEMGSIGAIPVILLYASGTFFLVLVGISVSKKEERYFCFLTATMIGAQAGINIGMNMGILPITGITLPLFSYGGSSILALCFQLGCVQSILQDFRKKETLYIR